MINHLCRVARFPLFDALAGCQHILLAGCGGGYDFFGALPLYFALQRMYPKTKLSIANLSFSDFSMMSGRRYDKVCIRIDANSVEAPPSAEAIEAYRLCTEAEKEGDFQTAREHLAKARLLGHPLTQRYGGYKKNPTDPGNYFPEYYTSCWFREKLGQEVGIYCFPSRSSIQLVRAAYQKIVDEEGIDAIVLVDGGTDSVMFGDEENPATIMEDHLSISAVYSVKGPRVKLLSAIGFGIDTFHGLSHGLFLENIATLIKKGGYLGAFSIQKEMEEVQLFMECYKYVEERMKQPSIVQTSIISAIEGHFGDYHATERTKRSKLFINSLMSIYWNFFVDSVYDCIPYINEKNINSMNTLDVQSLALSYFRQSIDIRRSIPLPM